MEFILGVSSICIPSDYINNLIENLPYVNAPKNHVGGDSELRFICCFDNIDSLSCSNTGNCSNKINTGIKYHL